MKILSLFDGISCGRVAIDRLGFKNVEYYASEIDKHAIQIALKNYPDTIELGDVREINGANYQEFDLLIGGSPCQDLSIAKKGREGLQGARSGLFFEYARILNEMKPKYFILENVASMPKEARDIISETLGVQPVMINASLVSAQIRKRLFWIGKKEGEKYVQVEIQLPKDRGILLKDILENGTVTNLKSYAIDANYFKGINRGTQGGTSSLEKGKRQAVFMIPEATKKGYAEAHEGQSVDLSFPTSKTRRGRVGDKVKNIMTSQNIGVVQWENIRKLTPIECERLQSLPDNYTEGISNTQRYKTLGNAFNVEVVRHILENLISEG